MFDLGLFNLYWLLHNKLTIYSVVSISNSGEDLV